MRLCQAHRRKTNKSEENTQQFYEITKQLTPFLFNKAETTN